MNHRSEQRVGCEIERVRLNLLLKQGGGDGLRVVNKKRAVAKSHRLAAAITEKEQGCRVIGNVDLRMIARADKSLRAREKPPAHGFGFAKCPFVDRPGESVNGLVERVEQHHAPGRKQLRHEPREGVAPGLPRLVARA